MSTPGYISFMDEDAIIAAYVEKPNVTALLRRVALSRAKLEALLRRRGVYLGFNVPPDEKKARSAARMETLQERHGVSNMGQTMHMRARLIERNARKTTEIPYLADYTGYNAEVMRHTRRNRKLLVPQDFCYLTGLKMLDGAACNPNDPLIRTIDHKVSVFDAFVRKMPAEAAGGISNLMQCIRHINSIKGNASVEDITHIAQYLREVYINAGYPSN